MVAHPEETGDSALRGFERVGPSDVQSVDELMGRAQLLEGERPTLLFLSGATIRRDSQLLQFDGHLSQGDHVRNLKLRRREPKSRRDPGDRSDLDTRLARIPAQSG